MVNKDLGLYYSQAYKSAYCYYFDALKNDEMPMWDYVFITSSNRQQKKAFEYQIKNRKDFLPKKTKFVIISDKDDERVGSGGSTLMVINAINQLEGINKLDRLKILVIHSGGDSKRIPQYSIIGKLFAPMPHELPNKRPSTLFDEIFITSARIASRIRNGMVILSGDALLLFNPLFINCYQDNAYAMAFEEKDNIACNHGVYVSDNNDLVVKFLHKQNKITLRKQKAYNDNGTVNIDTGLIIFSPVILKAFFKLIDTKNKYDFVVSNQVRLSLYGDLIYPLAKHSTLKRFYKEKAEGKINKNLLMVRKKIWELLRPYQLKLLKVKPGKFLHFGSSHELLNFYVNLNDYKSLGWATSTHSCHQQNCFCYNSYINIDAKIGKHCYIENSSITGKAIIGDNVILSNVEINDEIIPSNVVLSGVKLLNGSYTVRIYDINANPKLPFNENSDLTLWEAPLFPVCNDMHSALSNALSLYKNKKVNSLSLISLKDSFENADVCEQIQHFEMQYDYITLYQILSLVDKKYDISKLQTKDNLLLNANHYQWLKNIKDKVDYMTYIRLYLYLAKFTSKSSEQQLTSQAFKLLALLVEKYSAKIKEISLKTNKNRTVVQLPLRINFAGGWTDTPPYYYEHGGAVVNVPILFNKKFPVYIEIKRIRESKIIIESSDINAYKEFEKIDDLRDIGDPYDNFALHKCCLIVTGIIPLKGDNLKNILNKIGSGIHIKTKIINVPKGSGLGTSSILCLGLIKCLYNFFNHRYSQNELLDNVLLTEQLMSTGGGWQDQAGGLGPNFKLIQIDSGYNQPLEITPIKVATKTIKELNKRFVIIYSGQKRLARNLLRKVIGGYLENNKEIVSALFHIKRLAYKFQSTLEKGDLNLLGKLMNEQWKYSKIINQEASNSLIENIFMSINDLISGKMICGAGGGGFLQVLLKKGVSKKTLKKRLNECFVNSNIQVYDVDFYLDEGYQYEND